MSGGDRLFLPFTNSLRLFSASSITAYVCRATAGNARLSEIPQHDVGHVYFFVEMHNSGKRLGRHRIAPELEQRIRKALATPGRPGVRKIAERFGVDPGTVQRISRPRPFADGAASVVV